MGQIRRKLRTLAAIREGKYPPKQPREHSLLEKLAAHVAILASCLSFSNMKGEDADHNWMDWYILIWVALVSLCWLPWIPSWLAIVLSAYRLFDIVMYRVYFLLVKSQEKPWKPEDMRRSLVIVGINFVEAINAFAMLYWRLGAVAEAHKVVTERLAAAYFSAVTMLTVGFGDLTPLGAVGKWLVLLQIGTTVLFLIFLLPALLSVFSAGLLPGGVDNQR